MHKLSPAGERLIGDIAQRHGFSVEATLNMWDALMRANGSMAQFDHPEFAGSGQWMRGGMTMVSDMFNNALKSRVDALCQDLAAVLAEPPGLIRGGSFQSQSQGSGPGPGVERADAARGGSQRQQGSTGFGRASLFVPPPPGSSGDWWPAGLGLPNSTGAQNGVRYAYFAQARRLVIDVGGTVTVYDTLDHRIGGFSQQQSAGGTLSFSSQHGLIDVATLPVVSPEAEAAAAQAQAPAPAAAADQPAVEPVTAQRLAATAAADRDLFATIEKLAELRAKGILNEEEFAAKKAELLSRI